jgi:uncharacterized membrane protein
LKKLWTINKNKRDFWVTLAIFVVFLGVTLGKTIFGLVLDVTDIQLILSTVGAFIVFIGTVIGNSSMIEAGKDVENKKIDIKYKK